MSTKNETVDFPLDKKMAHAKNWLICRQPFFGNLICSMKFVEKNDMPMPTMGVDGVHIFYDRKFVEGLTVQELRAVLLHEIMHVAMMHFERKLSFRDVKKWNIATDLAINPIIKNMGEGVELPDDCLYDPAFKNMAAEQIYTKLPPVEEMDITEFDNHMPMDEEAADNFFKKMVNVYDSLSERDKGQGYIPGEVENAIKDLKKPKIPWRRFIKSTTESVFRKVDYNTNYLSNQYRMVAPDTIFPKLVGPENTLLVVAIDTSGSVVCDKNMLASFAAEMDGIISLASRTILISCDAKVQEVQEVHSFENSVKTLKFSGGGGTSFEPVFKYLIDKQLLPECLVYLTDGYGNFPSMAPRYPVVWCKGPSCLEDDQFPFGMVVTIDDISN
jgi:predicted metal-dependent peptidase